MACRRLELGEHVFDTAVEIASRNDGVATGLVSGGERLCVNVRTAGDDGDGLG